MKNVDKDVSIGGVFCGNRIAVGLFAEEVASRRYVIRQLSTSVDFAKRIGEVMGGEGRFQAMRMNGEHVSINSTLKKAANRLIFPDQAIHDSVK